MMPEREKAVPERGRKPVDPVEEAGKESFPASDPPSWTLGTGHRQQPGKTGASVDDTETTSEDE